MTVYNILWVEDDTYMMESLLDAVRDDKHYIEMVDSGTEAIKRVKKKKFDLIIIDLIIPWGNNEVYPDTALGVKLVQKLKEINKNKLPPIMIISVVREKIIYDQLLKLGISKDNILVKGILSPTEVKKHIYDLLQL